MVLSFHVICFSGLWPIMASNTLLLRRTILLQMGSLSDLSKHSNRHYVQCGVKETVEQKLNRFLLRYRNAPHCTTNEPPSLLFLNRRLRNCLHLIKANLQDHIDSRQQRGDTRKYRSFVIDQPVLCVIIVLIIRNGARQKLLSRLYLCHTMSWFCLTYYGEDR